MAHSGFYKIKIAPTLSIIFLLTLLAWVLHGTIGHRIIEYIYHNESITMLMSERHSTPLSDYYLAADRMVILYTLRFLAASVFLVVLIALIRYPLKVAVITFSLTSMTFLFFALFEFFPTFIRMFRLDRIVYYRNQLYRIPDNALAFRGRPFLNFKDDNFRGHVNLQSYGIDMPNVVMHWTTDQDGFRGLSRGQISDVVVIGDSFIEYGWNENDTFGRRLESHLPGWTVESFGIGGYGPFQYLEVLKKYGIRKRPKVAFFGYFEGNDIYGVEVYKQWRDEGTPFTSYLPGASSFWQRYPIALRETIRYLASSIWASASAILKSASYGQYEHPDVVVLRLPNGQTEKIVFVDKHPALSTDEMLRTESWADLKRILFEFKKVSEESRIRPIVLYIPMAVSIYAEFSTLESGRNWRRIRQQQIALMNSHEIAMLALSREVGIEMVNLSIAFRLAAREGTMLYEAIDTHWNSNGREIAATFVANTLKSKVQGIRYKLHRRDEVAKPSRRS